MGHRGRRQKGIKDSDLDRIDEMNTNPMIVRQASCEELEALELLISEKRLVRGFIRNSYENQMSSRTRTIVTY